MATSVHQPESLVAQITRLKAELTSYRNSRDQILAIGQSSSGGGTATTYPGLANIEAQIARREASIAALTAQLNGESSQPGVNLLSHASDYS